MSEEKLKSAYDVIKKFQKYAIPLTKPEIDALDMVLSSAKKNCFGTNENNDIIYFLSHNFSEYRVELNKETDNE